MVSHHHRIEATGHGLAFQRAVPGITCATCKIRALRVKLHPDHPALDPDPSAELEGMPSVILGIDA